MLPILVSTKVRTAIRTKNMNSPVLLKIGMSTFMTKGATPVASEVKRPETSIAAAYKKIISHEICRAAVSTFKRGAPSDL